MAERLPLLAEALPLIGHVSIRNRGTIGGSDRPRRRFGGAARGGRCHRRGDGGAKQSAASGSSRPTSSSSSHFTTALDDDELLTEVRIPSGPAGAGWAFDEIARRHGDFALVGVARHGDARRRSASETAPDRLIGRRRPRRAGPLPAEAALAGQTVDADTFAAAATEARRTSSRHPTSTDRPSSVDIWPASPCAGPSTTAAGRAGGSS